MLVWKHGCTCGFISLASLFISGIKGMTDILVIVLRSVLEEASLKMGNTCPQNMVCVIIQHISREQTEDTRFHAHQK